MKTPRGLGESIRRSLKFLEETVSESLREGREMLLEAGGKGNLLVESLVTWSLEETEKKIKLYLINLII